MKKKICGGVLLMTLLSLPLVAQKAVTTTGNNISNDNFSMDYSVGQIAFNINKNDEHSMISGIIQIFEITIPTLSAENLDKINLFPNPTNNVLRIESIIQYTHFRLYDLTGQLIEEGVINDNTIDVSDIAKSEYILFIRDHSGKPRKFKIIKN